MLGSITLLTILVLAVHGLSYHNCNDGIITERRGFKKDIKEEFLEVVRSLHQITNATQKGLKELEQQLRDLEKEKSKQADDVPVSEWYEKMVGTAVTVSGQPLGRRIPYEMADNKKLCQIRCDNSFPRCRMFAFSSTTRQCILFDESTVSSPMPNDTTLYTYYQYTAVSHVTSGSYGYTMLQPDLANISWIAFSLKSCGDAHIFLQNSRSANETNGYEFSIGGWWNSRTCLRRVRLGTVVECASGVFVDCNYTRWFWISWHGGIISFGTGKVVGENVEFKYTDATPYSVKAMGLSGWGNNDGAWIIHTPIWA